LSDSAEGIWVLVLAVVVVLGAPFVEELMFRGLLQGAFVRRINGVAAVLVVAAWFALIHFRPVEFPGLFAFGLVLGACALLTGRIGMSIAAHLAFNATGLALVAVAGCDVSSGDRDEKMSDVVDDSADARPGALMTTGSPTHSGASVAGRDTRPSAPTTATSRSSTRSGARPTHPARRPVTRDPGSRGAQRRGWCVVRDAGSRRRGRRRASRASSPRWFSSAARRGLRSRWCTPTSSCARTRRPAATWVRM
jgi:hypothetical protein